MQGYGQPEINDSKQKMSPYLKIDLDVDLLSLTLPDRPLPASVDDLSLCERVYDLNDVLELLLVHQRDAAGVARVGEPEPAVDVRALGVGLEGEGLLEAVNWASGVLLGDGRAFLSDGVVEDEGWVASKREGCDEAELASAVKLRKLGPSGTEKRKGKVAHQSSCRRRTSSSISGIGTTSTRQAEGSLTSPMHLPVIAATRLYTPSSCTLTSVDLPTTSTDLSQG